MSLISKRGQEGCKLFLETIKNDSKEPGQKFCHGVFRGIFFLFIGFSAIWGYMCTPFKYEQICSQKML